jgi:hypothetical protein
MSGAEGNRYRERVERMVTGRIAAENAQREREIRADLIEDVGDALKRVYNDAPAGGTTLTGLAEAAVDAVADYYRRSGFGAVYRQK